MRLNKKDLWIIFLFLSLVIIFFGQILFTQATYIFRDFYHSVYPTRYFASQCIKDGHFPFWNPYLYFGFPFFGSLQHGLLNPLSFLMYILPFDIGFKLFIVSHFYLAGIFMYLLMRDWKVGKVASLIAALTYTFNGYIQSIDTFSQITSACWTPLIFLFYNRAIITLKFRYVVLTGISLAFQFLGDELTVLYATIIILSLFALVKIFIESQRKPEFVRGKTFEGNFSPNKFGLPLRFYKFWLPLKEREKKEKVVYTLKIFFILPLVGLITVGLVFIQLLPFLETLRMSFRAEGVPYSEATKWSLSPLELLTLILPKKGGFAEFVFMDLELFKSLYFGIISFFLVLISLCERSKRNLFWMAIFLGSIILVFGNHLPFYKFLYEHFPFLSMHRYPVKFFCLTVFASSILAGFGFEYLLKIVKNRKIIPLIVLFIPNLLLIFILLIWYLNFTNILGIIKLYYFQPTSLDELIQFEGKYFTLFKNFSLTTTLFSIFNSLVILTKKFRLNIGIFTICLLIIIIVDLFFFGLNLNPLINQKFYSRTPPILKILKEDSTSINRFLIAPETFDFYPYAKDDTLFDIHQHLQSTLMPNFGLIYKIFYAQGYGFLTLGDYFKFNRILKSGDFSNVQKLLNMTNVKYIISKYEIPSEQVKLLYIDRENGSDIRLYENPTCLPRAFFVPETIVIKDRKEILRQMLRRDFDPRKEVIVEEEIQNPKSKIQNPKSKTNLKSKIQIIDYQPNKVILTASSSTDCLLFLSDTYYPGWKAYIDKKPTKIYRANFLFRAIVLPQGTHQIEFVYFPFSFKIGLIGTLITIISLAGYLIIKKIIDRKEKMV